MRPKGRQELPDGTELWEEKLLLKEGIKRYFRDPRDLEAFRTAYQALAPGGCIVLPGGKKAIVKGEPIKGEVFVDPSDSRKGVMADPRFFVLVAYEFISLFYNVYTPAFRPIRRFLLSTESIESVRLELPFLSFERLTTDNAQPFHSLRAYCQNGYLTVDVDIFGDLIARTQFPMRPISKRTYLLLIQDLENHRLFFGQGSKSRRYKRLDNLYDIAEVIGAFGGKHLRGW